MWFIGPMRTEKLCGFSKILNIRDGIEDYPNMMSRLPRLGTT